MTSDAGALALVCLLPNRVSTGSCALSFDHKSFELCFALPARGGFLPRGREAQKGTGLPYPFISSMNLKGRGFQRRHN